MLLRIDFHSGKPIYLQVADQIKAGAASGRLRPGEALPSIGALSGKLRVNRNAVAKAYSELEGLGLVESQPGGQYLVKQSCRPAPQGVQPRPLAPAIDDSLAQGPLALKTALRYALLILVLGALYLGLVLVGGRTLLSLAVVAAAVLPLRSLSGELSHRLVFAKRFELPRTLRILKAEAPSQPNLDSFIEQVSSRTEAVLGARLQLIRDRAEMLSLLHSFPSLRSARADFGRRRLVDARFLCR